MCGICGILNNNSIVDEHNLRTMMLKMKHRGPDDEGIFIDKNIGLGFVRLSIIDLSSGGHQPMNSSCGRYTMIYNGEIYNYIELRNDLKEQGVVFQSSSDSEVLLSAYITWGESCLKKLNGMFAFVIYDNVTKKLFGARDRYGIKPLYYYKSSNQLIFASEPSPILSIINTKVQANNQAIFDFLVFNRTDQTDETFFQGIKKLPHGHTFIWENGSFKISRWYKLADNIKNTFESTEEYFETLRSAVNLRLRSDVPIGVCLSGGLDSSSIVSTLLNTGNHGNLKTFSAVYQKGDIGDETEFINEYQGQLENMYHTYPTKDTLLKDIDHFIESQAEPVHSTFIYAQYKVMELAKDNVVVTLDGQGADEQLAGYHYFFGNYFKELLIQLRLYRLLIELIQYYNKHHSIYGLKTFLYFMLPNTLKTKFRAGELNYLNRDFYQQYSKTNNIVETLYSGNTLNNALINHFEYKLEHLLKWEDRNSMIFSIESRVPFLDYRLVERTLALDSKQIISGGNTKYILREAMNGILPEKIRTRQDKIGFDTPQDQWFRSKEFISLIQSVISSNKFRNRGIINPVTASKVFNNHLSGRINASKEIWKWINLEFWFQKFID